MARIEDKRNQKIKKDLASKIWTGFVVGVLAAVFVGVIVLGCIYLFGGKDDDNNEQKFEEQYKDATLITFENLEKGILKPNPDKKLELIDKGTIYVFVYSPDYETYPNGKKVSESVNDAVTAFGDNKGHDRFYVINTEAEDNKGYSLEGSTYLSELATLKSPYLLVIERNLDGALEIEEIIDSVRDINNKLAEIIE